MQHITKSILWLVRFIGFVFHEIAIHKKVRAFTVILGPYQFSKDRSVDGILIMNRMKHFYFMSVFRQAICDGQYVIVIRLGGIYTQHKPDFASVGILLV